MPTKYLVVRIKAEMYKWVFSLPPGWHSREMVYSANIIANKFGTDFTIEEQGSTNEKK